VKNQVNILFYGQNIWGEVIDIMGVLLVLGDGLLENKSSHNQQWIKSLSKVEINNEILPSSFSNIC
jgi:hypothetical protein